MSRVSEVCNRVEEFLSNQVVDLTLGEQHEVYSRLRDELGETLGDVHYYEVHERQQREEPVASVQYVIGLDIRTRWFTSLDAAHEFVKSCESLGLSCVVKRLDEENSGAESVSAPEVRRVCRAVAAR
jgi:hypothetical protein